jgi:hypothetical protein
MTALLAFALGLAAAEGLGRGLWWARRREERRRREGAVAVLRARGLRVGAYFATIGVEDEELRQALCVVAPVGHIVVDARGGVIGKWAAEEVGPRKRHLRLVVANDEER